MRLRNLFAAVFCFALPLALVAGERVKMRELDVKGLKIEVKKGTVKTPTLIGSVEELDKAIPNADRIKKDVDFASEKLVLFAWAGSGGDKLTLRASDDNKTMIFTYTPGLTRDLRQHVHLFAIPKGLEIKIEGGR